VRSFTVGAGSLEVAQGLYSALADFHPELLETDDGTYQVRVTLVGGDNAIIATLKAIEKHVAELGGGTDRVIMRHRERIVDRQLVLERLANMAIDLFATACVIARTQSLIDERGVEMCDREIALCDLFCVEAGRRFRRNRNMLDSKEEEVDETRRSVAGAVREGKGYFVTDAILDE